MSKRPSNEDRLGSFKKRAWQERSVSPDSAALAARFSAAERTEPAAFRPLGAHRVAAPHSAIRGRGNAHRGVHVGQRPGRGRSSFRGGASFSNPIGGGYGGPRGGYGQRAQPCRYLAQGRCHYGNSCRFSHAVQPQRRRPNAKRFPPPRDCPPPLPAVRTTIPNAAFTGMSDNSFSVLSYNVLAQQLLVQHSENYRVCAPWTLEWPYRKQGLLRELEAWDADVLGLQEVQSEHYEDFFLPELAARGYAGAYKKRTGSDKQDGCAIFWKISSFSLVRSIPLEFRQEGSALMDRDNVALIVTLRPPQGGQDIVVATTHLLFNPKRGDIKMGQISLLLAACCRESGGERPLIVCGDFNSTPTSALCYFMEKGQIALANVDRNMASGQVQFMNEHRHLRVSPHMWRASWASLLRTLASTRAEGSADEGPDPRAHAPMDESSRRTPVTRVDSSVLIANGHFIAQEDQSGSLTLSHGTRLASAYKTCLGQEPAFTTYNVNSNFMQTVDYIWYSTDTLEVVDVLDTGGLDVPIPSPEWSSDHVAIMTRLKYKDSGAGGVTSVGDDM